MGKELVINQTLNECRVVLIENDEILDYVIHRSGKDEGRFPKAGNIYKGKVLRILPGMQAAFVDIAFEKAAFLYVDDAYLPTIAEQEKIRERTKKEYELLKGDERFGQIIPDELSTLSESVNMRFRLKASLESFLKEGDEIMVQVNKEPISSKGPRITTHITLAGRYVVFMPFIEHVGVSKRIEGEKERMRLKGILDTIRPKGKGLIARTVAEGQAAKIIKDDFSVLFKIWKEISRKVEKAKAATLIYQDLTFLQRVLRDITDDDVERIVIDTKKNLREVDRFISKYLPGLKGKTALYTHNVPIFEHYNIDMEVERGLESKVFLRSGGSLNIDQTEALVSIDVNTGKYVGRKNLEETILRTNLEALREIAYQLRLRNCGGLIIIDFIDMEKEENRKTVYDSLVEALKRDRAKTNVLPISPLGLVEMTRKRTRDTLSRIVCAPCPYCEGLGRVKSKVSVCYELVRELVKVLKKNTSCKKVLIYAHPEVTAQLCDEEFDVIEELEEEYETSLLIRSENNYHVEQYEIFPQ